MFKPAPTVTRNGLVFFPPVFQLRMYSHNRLLNFTGFFSTFGSAELAVVVDMLRLLQEEWP